MIEAVSRVIEELKRYSEVKAIILFGSHAKGKVKPISDIDIAVLFKDPDLEAEIASYSSNVLDVVNFSRLPLYIQFEVLKHGKTLFVRDEEFLTRIKMEVLRDYLEMSYLYERMSERALA